MGAEQSAQLFMQCCEVAQNPCRGESASVAGEEGSAGVGEPTSCRCQAGQVAGVGSGVVQPGGCVVAVDKQGDDVVVEVGRPRSDGVAVRAPFGKASGLSAQRSTEDEVFIKEVVDVVVIPTVPQVLIEPSDQLFHSTQYGCPEPREAGALIRMCASGQRHERTLRSMV